MVDLLYIKSKVRDHIKEKGCNTSSSLLEGDLLNKRIIEILDRAIKRAKENEITFNHIRNRDWIHLRKPLIYSLLTGLTLGIYLLSWIGGLMFVFIIVTYLIVQYIIDHLKGTSNDYLCIIGVPMFLLCLIMVIPFSNLPGYGGMVNASLIIATLIPLVLSGVSRLMGRRDMKRAFVTYGRIKDCKERLSLFSVFIMRLIA